MPERLPVRINPFRLAGQRASLGGSVALAGMRRLDDGAGWQGGDAEVSLDFASDAAGRSVVSGTVSADLTLTCQRCLAPLTMQVKTSFELGLVRSDAEAARVQQEYEPLLIDDDTLFIADLVEDELILALPQRPAHDSVEECDQEVVGRLATNTAPGHDAEVPARENPFASLRELKRK